MKPFNLQAALRGEPVVTRDGHEVTKIHYFKNVCGYKRRIVALVGNNIQHFWEDGKYLSMPIEHCCDLFMASKKIAYQVRLYRNKNVKSNIIAVMECQCLPSDSCDWECISEPVTIVAKL